MIHQKNAASSALRVSAPIGDQRSNWDANDNSLKLVVANVRCPRRTGKLLLTLSLSGFGRVGM